MPIKKVLVVDDSTVDRMNIQNIISDAGYTVIAASSGQEAIEKAASEKPDLVFMDIHLADGSAFEIFERTQILCPIIFATAYDEYALKAFKVNSIDYLLKPIDPERLQLTMNKILGMEQQKNVVNNKIDKLLNFLNSGESAASAEQAARCLRFAAGSAWIPG
jgi:two-component SAPR family response regulator